VIAPSRFTFRERGPLKPVFLSNRQLLPVYDVASVLRAFALVQQRVSDARLIVAGDGSERRRLQSLARDLGLRGTEFIGWVAPEDMADLYAAVDVYLNGSASGDNAPVSILEAFAAGLPVVSSDSGGIPALVRTGETGILVAAGDPAEMAAAALRLLDDPELCLKLSRGARDECSRFTWEAVRDQWLELYAESPHEEVGRPLAQ
jgi:phenylacetate-CoA ligase